MRDAPDVDEEDRAAIRDTLRFFEVNRPTYSYTMAEAIADGHLVPYEIYRAMTARTAATEGFTVARGDIDWDALDGTTRTELEKLFAASDPLVVDPTALETGRAHVCTPVTNAHLVCSLLLEQKKQQETHNNNTSRLHHPK